MPVSSEENKDIAKKWIDDLHAKRVLDVGVGQGTYADLARTPEQHWYGIEAYYPYVEQFNLEGKYDEVIIGDARYINYTKLGLFDLIIIGDCVEHMEKQDSHELLLELLKHTKYLLVSFPVLHLDQHDDSNPFEEHIGHYGYIEMQQFMSGKIVKSIEGDILAYFLISDEL